MSITVPAAGDAINATWGQSVADQLNNTIILVKTADEGKTSNAFGDVAELTFPVVNGTNYSFDFHGGYTVGGTSTGISIGVNHPGGSLTYIEEIYDNDGSVTRKRFATTDASTGTTTTINTNQQLWRVWGRYVASADGTFALRYKRGGTSTTVTVLAGSGALIVAGT